MMENVEGILTTAKGAYVIETIRRMIELGYSVYMKKVYMQEHGIPQRRKRVFIVGNREGKPFDFPVPLEQATGSIFRSCSSTLKDTIGDLEHIENPEIDHIFKVEEGIQFERISTLKIGQSMKDLPEYLQHESFKKRASRRVCDGTPSEKRGGAPSGLKRLSYEEPCLTITGASSSEFIHPIKNRALTIRECARVQTFPDEFVFCGTDSQKMLQIGNAIPPLFAGQIAKQIILCDIRKANEKCASLVSYNVTKATAKSPALTATCQMLDELMQSNYVQ
jgi:DNA (cytosine-5)-methyltransferase 1